MGLLIRLLGLEKELLSPLPSDNTSAKVKVLRACSLFSE